MDLGEGEGCAKLELILDLGACILRLVEIKEIRSCAAVLMGLLCEWKWRRLVLEGGAEAGGACRGKGGHSNSSTIIHHLLSRYQHRIVPILSGINLS